MPERECTCDFKLPTRRSAQMAAPLGKYVIYLDEWQDETQFDPACPFHGEGGSMVSVVEVSGA